MSNILKSITMGALLILLSSCIADEAYSLDLKGTTDESAATTPISDPDPDPAPPSEPIEFIDVLLLNKTEKNTVTATDCMQVKQILEGFPVQYIRGLEDGDLEILTFTNEMIDRVDNRIGNLDGSILASPILWEHYQLSSLEVDKEIWESQEYDSIDFNQAVLESECFAIKQVSVQTDEYSLMPVDSLLNWHSNEAINNQRDYDNEIFDIFKVLYGRDGLGYGDFAKAGVHLKHVPLVPGSEWNYNEYSLSWILNSPDIEILSEQLLPDVIIKKHISWQQDCSAVEIQFAKDIQFLESTPVFSNFPEDCHEQPLLLTELPSELADPNSAEFQQYLDESRRFHYVTQQKSEDGEFISCNPQDTISLDGCSQPIVRTTGKLLEGFIKEEHDLYVKVSFTPIATRTYYLNRVNGVMMELGSE